MENKTVKTRVKRSEKLLPDERRRFASRVSSFDTKIDAAEFFGFSTITLDAVLLKGSGKPDTISKIKSKI